MERSDFLHHSISPIYNPLDAYENERITFEEGVNYYTNCAYYGMRTKPKNVTEEFIASGMGILMLTNIVVISITGVGAVFSLRDRSYPLLKFTAKCLSLASAISLGITGLSIVLGSSAQTVNSRAKTGSFCKSILRNYIASLPIGKDTDLDNLRTKRGFLDAVESVDPIVLDKIPRVLIEEVLRCNGDITNQNLPSFLHSHLSEIRELKAEFQILSEVEKASFSLLKDLGHTDLERKARNLAGTFYSMPEIARSLILFFSLVAKELKRELGFNS